MLLSTLLSLDLFWNKNGLENGGIDNCTNKAEKNEKDGKRLIMDLEVVRNLLRNVTLKKIIR